MPIVNRLTISAILVASAIAVGPSVSIAQTIPLLGNRTRITTLITRRRAQRRRQHRQAERPWA